MKQKILMAMLVCCLFGCKKNDTDITQGQQNLVGEWILTYDESPTEYTYLKNTGGSGTPLYRDKILKTYDLAQLAVDADCEVRIKSMGSANNKETYTIQSAKNMQRWWSVDFVNNANNPEGFVRISGGTITEPPCGGSPTDCDDWKFFLHRMPAVNGIITAAIESVKYPGWSVSSQPATFQYASNLLTVQKYSGVDKATKFQFRRK